jgi:hypothetical protein
VKKERERNIVEISAIEKISTELSGVHGVLGRWGAVILAETVMNDCLLIVEMCYYVYLLDEKLYKKIL